MTQDNGMDNPETIYLVINDGIKHLGSYLNDVRAFRNSNSALKLAAQLNEACPGALFSVIPITISEDD